MYISDADGEAAETIKQAQSERARGIQNLQDQLKEAKMMQDKQDEQNLFEKVGIFGPLARPRLIIWSIF